MIRATTFSDPFAPVGLARWARRGVSALLALVVLGACADEPLPTQSPTDGLDAPQVAAAVLDPAVACAAASMPDAECAYLVEFYNATGGPGWLSNDGWGTDPNPCNWYGVTCVNETHGSVEVLQLGGNDLVGSIPSSIDVLTSLRRLALYWNDLSGTLPPELGSLPALEYLGLYGNPWTGSIPSELGNLANLEALLLGYNDFSGGIPVELSQLSQLDFLFLHEAGLEGEIPSELGTLSQLEYLDLAGNALTGPIPASLGSLSLLEELHLQDNQLSGTIPESFGNLDVLWWLTLSGNELSGPLPTALMDMDALRYLYLSGNPVGGSMPSWLGTIETLDRIHMASTGLTGPIPGELGDLTGLEQLDLQGNALTGAIPESLTQITGLIWLLLDTNHLSGQVSVATAAFGDQVPLCSWSENDLFIPDLAEYRAVDDGDLEICGIPLSSAEDLGEDTTEDIWDLVPGTLGEGLANALVSKIENAMAKADAGQYHAAINQMMAFINQLEDMVTNGVLTQEQAQPFLDQATAMIAIWETML